MTFDQAISQFILFIAMATGAVVASMWLGIVLWTFRDVRARSRDVLAQWAATLMVAILNVFGLILYLMLRPHETLTEAYERSLEEEALLQGIEEKPVCPGCGRPSNAQWQVCPHCHTRLKKPCINCGQLLDLPWNLCPFCATPQGRTEADSRSGRGRRAASIQDRPAEPRTAEPQPVADDPNGEDALFEYADGDEA